MLAIRYDGGVTLRIGDLSISLDAGRGGDFSCITHAHMDHAAPSTAKPLLMTDYTNKIFRARGLSFSHFLNASYGSTITPTDDLKITPLDSGHMLGSSVFVIESGGHRVAYTGDLNTVSSILHGPAEVPEADILIIEATYGSPSYRFQPRERIYSSIARWVSSVLREGSVPSFNVYAAGKAQEIIALVNSVMEVPVVTSRAVKRVSSVYKHRYPWMDFLCEDEPEAQEVVRSNEYVYVSNKRPRLAARPARWAVATGWALHYSYPDYDAAFALSGHADFSGLCQYVEEASPRHVFTVYGHSGVLARYLRRQGYRAISLEEKPRIEIK